VIVRIATEGQYELPPDDEAEFNQLDQQAVAGCESGDEPQFHDAFAGLLDFVRTHGKQVGGDELAPSDRILPPPDTSLREAAAEFTGEGLIPG